MVRGRPEGVELHCDLHTGRMRMFVSEVLREDIETWYKQKGQEIDGSIVFVGNFATTNGTTSKKD